MDWMGSARPLRVLRFVFRAKDHPAFGTPPREGNGRSFLRSVLELSWRRPHRLWQPCRGGDRADWARTAARKSAIIK